MPYGDENRNVKVPQATPLEPFSMESTERCSFGCSVCIFAFEMSAPLSWKEKRGYSARFQRSSTFSPKSLKASFVWVSNENRKGNLHTSGMQINCRSLFPFVYSKGNATKWRKTTRSHIGSRTVLAYERCLGHHGTSPMPYLFTKTGNVDGLTVLFTDWSKYYYGTIVGRDGTID